MSSCSIPVLKIAAASDVLDKQYVCPCEKAQLYLPICVSLHFCGTATVPPTSKTVRARSVATVNTADFSPGLYIKLPRTLREDSGTGPKRGQVSSISSPKTSMRTYRLSSSDVCVHLWPKSHSPLVSPDSVFCLCAKRQTRSSEPAAGDSVDLRPVWQHVRSHLSPGHRPSPAPSSGSIHLPRKVQRLVLRCQNSTYKFRRSVPVFCWLFMRRWGGQADGRPPPLP